MAPEDALDLGEGRFEGVWILFFSASGFMLVPTAGLPADAREFIVAKVKSAGDKVD